MLAKSFFNRQATAVTALLRCSSINSFICQSRSAEFSGADAIALELGMLPPEERNFDNFHRIMSEIRLPFMFINYRSDQWLGEDDEARQECLLVAAEAGAELIDVMGDLYGVAPRELSTCPKAIEKQKVLIKEIHSRGAKVIMSSHMSEALSANEVLEHLQEQRSRGADIVKIVTAVNSEEEFLEAIKTTMLLNKKLEVPFVHLCGGKYSRMHRFMGTKLGNAITFAVSHYDPETMYTQPLIKSFKKVMENIPWHIDDC